MMQVNGLNTAAVYRTIAKRNSTEPYIIQNDCNRALTAAYTENKILFEQNGYNAKPSLKEFIEKELKIKAEKDVIQLNDFTTLHGTEHLVKKAEDISKKQSVSEPAILNIDLKEEETITMPIRIMYEYYYLKGYLAAKEGKPLDERFFKL